MPKSLANWECVFGELRDIMPSKPKDLSRAISLSGSRLDIIQQHYRESNNFFSRSFIEKDYQSCIRSLVADLKEYVLINATDLDGNNFIKEKELVIELETNYGEANARVKVEDGKVKITLTIGLFVLIDLMYASMWVHASEITGETSGEEQAFERKMSADLVSFIATNVYPGMPVIVKRRLDYFFSSAESRVYSNWAIGTALSALFIIGHELGHYFCGHLNYISKDGKHSQFTDRISELLFDKYKDGLQLVEKYKIKWSMELMADTYGINFLYMVLINEVETGFFKSTKSRDIVSYMANAALIPQVAFLMNLDLENNFYESVTSYYPSVVTRIFNSLATILFALFPIPNEMDSRQTPLLDLDTEYFAMSQNPEVFIFSLLEVFDSINSFCAAWNYYKLYDRLDTNYQKQFIDSIIGSRLGMTATAFKAGESNIALSLAQWQLSIEELSNDYIFRFSNNLHADDRLFRYGQLLKIVRSSNDPAMKILNDWMVQVFYAVNSPLEERKMKWKECEIFGLKVLTWYKNTYG